MKKAFTLVEVMIVIAIIVTLAAIAIPNLLRARAVSNETVAQATLKTISNACEAYAARNSGIYPANEADLTGANPSYLNSAYNGLTVQGYDYTASFALGSYCYQAEASSLMTGSRSFTISTGGILQEAAGLIAPACP